MKPINVKGRLLGSSPTFEGIQDVIASFYCGERKPLLEPFPGAGWWAPYNAAGKQIPNVSVRLVKGRYRFESYA